MKTGLMVEYAQYEALMGAFNTVYCALEDAERALTRAALDARVSDDAQRYLIRAREAASAALRNEAP